MEYLHAIILGVVQGVAEFLPISSSGHLVIADALLREFGGTKVPKESVTMEIALHFGTLMSILVVYRNDLLKLLADRRLIFMIVVATVPVGIIGILLKESGADKKLMTPFVAGCGLFVTACFLLAGRKLQRESTRPLTEMSFGMATIIGLFQAIAIIPGVSRSGSTIAAGVATGLDRENAARFSFLIAIPAIGGATLVQLKNIVGGEESLSGEVGALLLGTVVAFVVGLLALRWLIKVVVADRLHLFAIYCAIAGVATVVWQTVT